MQTIQCFDDQVARHLQRLERFAQQALERGVSHDVVLDQLRDLADGLAAVDRGEMSRDEVSS